MRNLSLVAGLALGSAFLLACSSSGDNTGGGGTTGGAGTSGGAGTGGSDAGGRGGASAGTGGVAGTGGGAAGTTGGNAAGTGGAATGIAGTSGSAGRGGNAAGASGTGGAAAGSSGGAGTFGLSGPTRCDTTLPLCESFENGLDGNLWKTTKAGDATVTVDEVHAARGTKALHVKTVAGGGSNFAYIKETKTFPATNNV